ncbi:uncharacterized protein LOC141627675 [Silene latifolia]|uniref:uncharacterized protein LOC141627675 n=1 Tax=Silene latifolia TaxID=37657 RepID=UPI003D76E470
MVSKADPIKYILSRPVLSGKLAKWAMLLKQYDLVFVPQKVVKGQAIADFFADHPVPAESEISDDLPGEEIFYVDVLPPWQMYFDGAARQDRAGAGVVFITPQNHLMPYAFTLTQLCTNNMAEYQALILGLQMAIKIGVRDMDIYGDSKLVVNQVLGEYEVKKEDLIPYHQQALQLLNQLDDIHPLWHSKAKESMQVPVYNRWVVSLLEGEENVDITNMICVYTVDEDDWRQPIIDFLDHQKLPDDPRHKFYANFIHQPPEPLHPTVSSWPFEAWGLDVVGPLTPKASNGHEYILAATDYFSKWAEAITLREVKKENVVDFIRTQIIYRYGVPRRITTDNGKQFFNHLMTSLGKKFKFK